MSINRFEDRLNTKMKVSEILTRSDTARLAAVLEAVGEGRWKCTASCNIQSFGDGETSVARVVGEGYGSTQDEACRNAKRDATQKAPRGSYARHCQCKCKKV